MGTCGGSAVLNIWILSCASRCTDSYIQIQIISFPSPLLLQISIFSISAMPPKKPSSLPLRDVLEIVIDINRTSRGLRITEREVLVVSSKDKKIGQPSCSKSKKRSTKASNMTYTIGHISSDNEETIPLRRKIVEEERHAFEDDMDNMEDLKDGEVHAVIPETHGWGNACA